MHWRHRAVKTIVLNVLVRLATASTHNPIDKYDPQAWRYIHKVYCWRVIEPIFKIVDQIWFDFWPTVTVLYTCDLLPHNIMEVNIIHFQSLVTNRHMVEKLSTLINKGNFYIWPHLTYLRDLQPHYSMEVLKEWSFYRVWPSNRSVVEELSMDTFTCS